MSQYPFPYSAPDPNAFGVGTGQAAAVARRAAVLLFVLGGLMLACGTCYGVLGAATPQHLMEQAIQQQPWAADLPINMEPARFFRMMLLAFGMAAAISGVTFLVLGFLVHRGSFAATIVALVLNAAIVLLALVGLTLSLSRGPNTQEALGFCMAFAFVGLMVWQIVWLVQTALALARNRMSPPLPPPPPPM